MREVEKLYSIELVETNDTVINKPGYEFIVDKALEFKLGARGLRSIVEAIMMDAMYTIPSQKDVKELHVTLDYAKEKFEKSDVNRLQFENA